MTFLDKATIWLNETAELLDTIPQVIKLWFKVFRIKRTKYLMRANYKMKLKFEKRHKKYVNKLRNLGVTI